MMAGSGRKEGPSIANKSGNVDLQGAEMVGTNLEVALLRKDNLNGANLEGANLSHARLQGATMRGAILAGVDLSTADLSEATISRGASEFPVDIQRILRAHAIWVDSSGTDGARAILPNRIFPGPSSRACTCRAPISAPSISRARIFSKPSWCLPT
jgi:uncharacterized protein YjbI with pentapeptide repeats